MPYDGRLLGSGNYVPNSPSAPLVAPRGHRAYRAQSGEYAARD